jgi:starch phosphorylase
MQQMAAGVDVWINTPLRPWEACGTSGMKLLANGGVNLSVLDGWWAEAYSSEVGWALGEGHEHSEAQADPHEAAELYNLLENQVVPDFYHRDAQGAPAAWISRIRASMSQLALQFTSRRMMREYVEQTYLPGAAAYRRRAANGAAVAQALKSWQDRLNEQWKGLRFGELRATQTPEGWRFDVQVYFGELGPDLVKVELYADAQENGAPTRMEMACLQEIPGAINGYLYSAVAPASRPSEHYTPRMVPFHPEAQAPLEDAHILWQR